MKTLPMLLASLIIVWGAPGHLAAQTYPSLTPPEQQAMFDTFQYALENNRSNEAADWVNPDQGKGGAVIPVQTFSGAQGEPCREFITTITIGGRDEQDYGTACRQPDGSWQIKQTGSAPPNPAPVLQKPVVYAPPAQYYYYPQGFFDTEHIYLSFGFIHRAGHIYRGSYYLDGSAFRYRYPLIIHERIYLGTGLWDRHSWYRDHRHGGRHFRLEDRSERRYKEDRGKKGRHDYREDRWGDPDRGRGRGGRR
jgi:surface antigen